MKIIDREKIRWYQLRKQNLFPLDAKTDYKEILSRDIGLHSTDYLTPYLSLWARTGQFDPVKLFADLNNHGQALRLRAFRGTVFVIAKSNIPHVLGASSFFNQSPLKEFRKIADKEHMDVDKLEIAVIDLVKGHNHLPAGEIIKKISPQRKGTFLSYIVRYLEFKGILARTFHQHLTDQKIKYGLMEEWVPDLSLPRVNKREALNTMVLNYILQFGPVCPEDIQWWFPITRTLFKEVLSDLRDQVVECQLDSRSYWMEKVDLQNFEKFCHPLGQPPVVHLLPYEDHYPKAYFLRHWFLDDDIRPLVYEIRPIERGQLRPTVWLNGQIIGRWEIDWESQKKKSARVNIIALKKEMEKRGETNDAIAQKREELQEFINQRLVPMMKPSQSV